MNADLKTSYPITDAAPGAVAAITLKKQPCAVCNYPTDEADRLCSIACKTKAARPHTTAPLLSGNGMHRIVYSPGSPGRGNYGSFRRTFTMDNQNLN